MSKQLKGKKLSEAERAWLSSVTINADGSRTVVFLSSRKVTLPKGLRLFLPKDDFYDRLAADVDEGLDHAESLLPILIECIYGKDRRPYKILVSVVDDTVWVSANAPREQLAVVAEYRDRGGYLQEVRAAASPESSGNGVYRQILKALRRHFKKPLHSDDTLSPHNTLVWMSQGPYAGGYYRINPRRRLTQRQSNAAIILAVSEVSLGDRIA